MYLHLCLATLLLLANQVNSQTTTDVTVDDAFSYNASTRSGIQYLPSESNWLASGLANAAQRFNSTIHKTNTTSTRLMFFFQGSDIYYYGDTGPGYGTVIVNIDGEAGAFNVVNASSSSLQYQQLLWSRTGLAPGDHQIIISKNDSLGIGQVSMDYFRIASSSGTIVPSTSGPGASTVPDQALIVDNTDSSITYSGEWELIRGLNRLISPPYSGFYRNTVHRTTVPGAVATFTFTGTAVWYFSDLDSTHGYVEINIDDGPSEQVSGYHNPILSQRLIWYKAGLSSGQHVVTITHTGTSTQYATLDFFAYLPSNATTTAPGVNPSSTNTTQGENEHRKTGTAVIIGGTIAGLVGLGAILYAIFLVHRRRAQWASHVPKRVRWDMRPASEMARMIEPYEATPFIVGHENRAATPMPTDTTSVESTNSTASTYSYTTTSNASEFSSYATAGTSRSLATYSQYDSPPSYR